MEEEDEYEDGHQVDLDHDEDKLTSKEIDAEHLQEREYGNEQTTSTETKTEHQMEDEDDSEELSLKGTDTDQMEDEEEVEELSLKETDTNQMKDEDDNEEFKGTDTYQMDGEEVLTTEIDSDLNKSDSLPSLADSEEQPNTPEEMNDVSDNHAAQNTNQYIKPSIKKERHIADALPNDIDLLADYESETSESQDATKLTWSAFQIAFLISAPLTIIGLALLVMGALNVPPTFNLLTIGVPLFIIAGLVFGGSTLFLCFYKAKKMRLFEFGDNIEGEIAGEGNMSYAHDEETMVPKVTYNNDEQTPL